VHPIQYLAEIELTPTSALIKLQREEDRPFSIQEHAMRKVLHGYAKDKSGNLILIGTMPVPFSKDKCSPAVRQEKRHLVRQGATIFKKEIPTREPR
jgi:hypothetical protein